MSRKSALFHVVMIGVIVAYGTVNLYSGNFERTYSTLPLLFLFYIFVTARQRKSAIKEKDDEE